MIFASSQVVEKVDEAFYWIGGISLVFFVGIILALLWFVYRYHRSRHPRAEPVHGNTPLEITWIVIPTLLTLVMFWKGYEGFRLMRDVPAGAMEVEVEARQWAWTFRYKEEGISTSELYVPAGKPVKLLLTSAPGDVIHSFYLPAFRTKEDCVPGRTNYMWFQADRPDVYNIFCAEFCGKDHARMLSRLHVLPPAEYEKWVVERLSQRVRPVDLRLAMDPKSQEIQDLKAPALYATYCASCHGNGGEGGLVEGARDFRKLTGWKRGPTIADMFRTLSEGLAGTQMRSFANLTPWERFAVSHHVASFYQGTDRPANTPEQLEALVKEYKLDQQQPVIRSFPIDAAIEQLVEGTKKQ